MTSATQEIGYVTDSRTGTGNFWMFDPAETTPELQWPQSVWVYDQMRRQDAQVGSVLEAVCRPVLRTPWRIDPAGARDEVVEFVADDLGLPIVGDDPDPPARTKDRFSWSEHLELALLMLPFGHMYFEQVYRVADDGSKAHLGKLSPRMPRTIEVIDVARDGGLVSITQCAIYGSGQKPIPVNRLVAYIYKREGGNWLGRSILRQAYKNWLIKDRLLRVQAQTIERNGMGIPLFEDPPDATPEGIAAGEAMAKAWRSGEAAGGRIPNGAKLSLVGVTGQLPDALPAIKYHDEQIARAVLAHFLNLDNQSHGSYALGTSFMDFFTLSLQTVAQSVADVASMHIVEDLVDVNWGAKEPAPRITFDEIGSRQAATAQAVKTLVDAKVISPDAVLETSTRQQYGLPPADPETARDGGPKAPAPSGGPITAGSSPPSTPTARVEARAPYPGQHYKHGWIPVGALPANIEPDRFGVYREDGRWFDEDGGYLSDAYVEKFGKPVIYSRGGSADGITVVLSQDGGYHFARDRDGGPGGAEYSRDTADVLAEGFGAGDLQALAGGIEAARRATADNEDDETAGVGTRHPTVHGIVVTARPGGAVTIAGLGKRDEKLTESEALDLIEALESMADEQPGKVEAAAKFDPQLHPRGAEGRFRTTLDKIVAGLRKWADGGGKGDPFEGFTREQLRRTAVARGIKLQRGASEHEIRDHLLVNLRDALAGDEGPSPVKKVAKKAVPKAAPKAPDQLDLAKLRELDAPEAIRDALDLHKVPELKDALGEAGLSKSGRKRELVNRLVEHLAPGKADKAELSPRAREAQSWTSGPDDAAYDAVAALSRTEWQSLPEADRAVLRERVQRYEADRGGGTQALTLARWEAESTPEIAKTPRKRAPKATKPTREPAKPVPASDLFEADDATVETALRDVFEGQFGPYTTKVRVSVRRARTRTDKRGREHKVEPSISVEGTIYDGDGHEIGHFGRSISPVEVHYADGTVRREIWAEHQIVELGRGDYDENPTKYHGTGFGGEFNRRAIEWYRASGVHGIYQDDHNGYVWASQGFNFGRGGEVPGYLAVDIVQLIDDLRAGRTTSEATKDEYRRIPKRFRDAPDLDAQIASAAALLDRIASTKPGEPGYPTAYEISQLGRRKGQKGKTSLWLGKLLFVSADEMILNPDEGETISP